MQYSGTTALVTGASSGLGAAFADALSRRGADLVLVARRSERIASLAAQLTARDGTRVETLTSDLSDLRPAGHLHDALAERGVRVSTLVNCAGLGTTGAFTTTAPDEIQQQISVNVAALADLCSTFLPDLLATGRGALVNVASVTGFAPAPGMAVYAATKAFVISFTEALAYELRDNPLRVLALSPGPTRTGFYASSGTSEQNIRFQEPKEVVDVALSALDARRRRSSVISGRRNQALARLMKVLPRPVLLRAVAAAAKPA